MQEGHEPAPGENAAENSLEGAVSVPLPLGVGERRQDYRSALEPVWCPGCGDFYVLDSLADALVELRLPRHMVSLVSGIGCSSRIPGYMSTYGFNSIHGRALPIASGLKLARPEITVVVAAGDGDAFSIGGGHLVHAVRRNVDLTLLVMDNGVYGLTKGQVSPTTPLGALTKTTEQGAFDSPVNPLELMLVYGCGFVAQAYSADTRGMTELIIEAMRYPGFSFLNIVSPCPTFRGGMGIYKDLRSQVNRLASSGHDASDYEQAMAVARDGSRIPHGVLYRRTVAGPGLGADAGLAVSDPAALRPPLPTGLHYVSLQEGSAGLERIAALAERYR
ncbi:2-oxoacid:ferredoxin oxidoreductase subunit beta [bacterium]|nr:2-oxoacid:ferredoxin oxidoreductase subunit beta [bacterium]